MTPVAPALLMVVPPLWVFAPFRMMVELLLALKFRAPMSLMIPLRVRGDAVPPAFLK